MNDFEYVYIVWIALIITFIFSMYAMVTSVISYVKYKRESRKNALCTMGAAECYRCHSIDEFDMSKMDDGLYVVKKEYEKVRYYHLGE